MARFPFLNADGTFQSAQVKTQLDARTDARMRDQLPALAEELGIGGSGSGVEEVSGTVTLDATGPAIREVYATAAATVQGEPLAAGDAAVFRRLGGAWDVMVVAKDTTWRRVGTAPTTPAPEPTVLEAPTVSATPSPDGTSLAVSWTSVSGAAGYALRLNGGIWSDRGAATAGTLTVGAGQDYTVEVAGYKVSASELGAIGKASGRTSSGLATTTDHFLAPHGTALTAWSGGGLIWSAPVSGDNNLTSTVGTIRSQTIGGVTCGGAITTTAQDARITVRYTMAGPAGSGDQVRLHGRGKGALIMIRGDLSLRDDVALTEIMKVPNTRGEGASGTLSLEIVGTTGTVYHNGVKVGNTTVQTGTGNRWGFATNGAARVTAFKIEAATSSSQAPTIDYPYTAAGTIIASETFTGSDMEAVTGRLVDNAIGGSASLAWLAGVGDGGWSGSSLGVAGGQGVRSGTGNNVSMLPVKTPTPSITAKLIAPPTASAAMISVADKSGGRNFAIGMRVTPTSVTPWKDRTDGLTSFGTPRPGDIYSVSVKGNAATFTAKRADGTNIGVGTQTLTFTGVNTDNIMACVHAESGSAGQVWDDLKVGVAA